MRPISYLLQFRGRANPVRANMLALKLTAPSSALVTTISAMGVRGPFNDISGGEAALDSELLFSENSSFADRGAIQFGPGNTLRFRGLGGRLTDSPDPHLKHGAVIREVEGGEGQFAGSEGLITSNLLISDTGEVTENQFGLIFVRGQDRS
jgi:hypothetical protein